VEEAGAPRAGLRAVTAGAVTAPARPIAEVSVEAARARPTGVTELDRVLGGGLVPGAVLLLAGEPGVGKSTLLLEVAQRYASGCGPALVVTGEESAAQVRLRAERLDALHPSLYLAAETDLSAVLAHLDAVVPGLLIVDSVQTIASSGVDGSAGGVTQVRAVASALIAVAKERGIAVILVGHVTKDGAIAGPRVLEHLVDVVLHFEGDRHSTLRLVRAIKNRYGAADEVGCFEMHDKGIRGLADPSGLFLTERAEPVPGTCLSVTVEGRRPLMTEVQALVGASALATPRRAVSGLDSARVAMVLAVVERRGRIRLGDRDVFAATVGGVRVTEPAADLAIALAVASASRDTPLPPGLVAVGEVGLSGDVRRVSAVGRRLAEAARLGYKRALVPPGCDAPPQGMAVTEVSDLGAALRSL
jgi:DNA repair protein RadA/Sms